MFDKFEEITMKILIWVCVLAWPALVLFLMFAVTNFIASLLFEGIAFDWRRILIQALVFGFFFRIFHAVRKGWNNAWKNK